MKRIIGISKFFHAFIRDNFYIIQFWFSSKFAIAGLVLSLYPSAAPYPVYQASSSLLLGTILSILAGIGFFGIVRSKGSKCNVLFGQGVVLYNAYNLIVLFRTLHRFDIVLPFYTLDALVGVWLCFRVQYERINALPR